MWGLNFNTLLLVLAEVRKYSTQLPLLGTCLVKQIDDVASLPHTTRTRKGPVATALH